jgi:hypothetical protein
MSLEPRLVQVRMNIVKVGHLAARGEMVTATP